MVSLRRTGGSSPLARGLPGPPDGHARPRGIIPARAGFTKTRMSGSTPNTDHPRSRGVYADAAWAADLDAGSSPLARGLPRTNHPRAPPRGIIPARAGFTSGRDETDVPTKDHPRSRGVYDRDPFGLGLGLGSSPLARGLPYLPPARPGRGRIIPARAGFTISRRKIGAAGGGSSPLARGLPTHYEPCEYPSGIIPARAGFTTPSSRRSRTGRDHPRSRGVYYRVRLPRSSEIGSSPFARGLPRRRHIRAVQPRIIPARAGFTSGTSRRSRQARDHPRSRGVYAQVSIPQFGGPGSSPLARGLLIGYNLLGEGKRIIPARAGFT